MEKSTKMRRKDENGRTNGIKKSIDTTLLHWANNITSIDLSKRNITHFDENTKFPENLNTLDLSNNYLNMVPHAVLDLKKLKSLNLSYNKIIYFDDTPNFCNSIVHLNLSHNNLSGPPYWVWVESPENLSELNLSYNINITKESHIFEELLQYSTAVINLKISNCALVEHRIILSTFPKAKTLDIGSLTISCSANHLEEIPCVGFDKCFDVEKLNVCNTRIYNVKPSIDMFKNIVEIDLSNNYLRDLPEEFCNLEKLEVCILSCNELSCLPDDISKLKSLTRLHLDNNVIYILPDGIEELKDLQLIDLYNNGLYEVPNIIFNVMKLDLAQNYFDEPSDTGYLEKREKLRINCTDRYDGRKCELQESDNDYYSDKTTDDEELLNILNSTNNEAITPKPAEPPSSPEDWDSDDYWIPCNIHPGISTQQPLWLQFVKQKMAEGNFCPMDAHTVPIIEKVKYEQMCNPKVWYEIAGQFSDYSDDSS